MTLAGQNSSTPLSQAVGRSHMYLSLSKEHRVSRSVRATWFLGYLFRELPPELIQQESDGADRDFTVLFHTGSTLLPHTKLFYICQQYSLVFLLDLSENMRSVSNHTHLVKVDMALTALQATLILLTRPLYDLELELCVSVLAYCGNSAKKVVQVLLQGVYMTQENCPQLLERVRVAVTQLELSISSETASANARSFEDHRDNTQASFEAQARFVGDTGLETMVKAGSLALQLLPRCALKGLVLLTDGVSGFSSPTSMHSSINGMRGANVSCWVVHIGGGPHLMDTLGHVPDIETLQFMTNACNGCVMDTNKIQEAHSQVPERSGPNAVQQAVLLWTFQQGALEERVKGVASNDSTNWEDPFTPIIDRVFTRTTITAPLLCLVGCKIREGFFFKHIAVKDTSLEVGLYYPWQPAVTIFYTITAPWPVTDECESLQIVISYEGPYSFVHDIHCEFSPPVNYSYRLAAIRKFKQAMQKFSSSDALLAHFLSFPTTPTHYSLPQSISNGMPLFYFPPNQSKPAPSLSLDSSGGKAFSSLVSFWRPMCTIDTSQWFRWFHTNKIPLVLQQDSLLPAHLLSPAPSGRYATIQCRLSASHLYNFLKLWSSLALLENHSYIRFLPSAESPRFFCVVRVASVLPCVVLHVGHIQGTPHSLQAHTVSSLVTALKELTFTPSERPMGTLGRKRVLVNQHRQPSATVLDKQLQKVMIRYEHSGGSSTGLISLVTTEERQAQTDYLSCTRWVYSAPHTTPKLLAALLRRRLREGFLLSSSRNGVVSLIAQLNVKQPSSTGQQALLLQYVLFPFSEHPTVELWVEPQYGKIVNTPPGLSYLNEATHTEIANKIHNIDNQLLTSVASFLYLQGCCQPNAALAPPPKSRDPVLRSCDPIACQLDIYPGSLFESSRTVVLTLTAFTERADTQFVDLDCCSALNSKFWNLLCQWLTALAPTHIPTLTNAHTLLKRLTASQPLANLRDNLKVSTATEWRYFALSNGDSVTQLYLPDMFYSTTEGSFVVPLVIMDCELTHLVDPDPMSKELPQRAPDFHLHCPLSARLVLPQDTRDGLNSLISSLGHAHLSSYLEVVGSALSSDQELSPVDFNTALGVCSGGTVNIDLTPLLVAFCPHGCIQNEEGMISAPLITSALARLLEGVVSRQWWCCAVRVGVVGEEQPFYQHWGDQTRAAFSKTLTESQFKCVPHCTGYYHWREESENNDNALQQTGMVSPVSVTSTLAQPPDELTELTSDPTVDIESDCSSDVMDIDPLFSDSEESEHEVTPPTPQSHAPLLLYISFSLKNKLTGQVLKLSNDTKARPLGEMDYIKDTIPLCIKQLSNKLLPEHDYFVAMELNFLSFSLPTHQERRSETIEESDSEDLVAQNPLSSLPQTHQPTAKSLKQRLEWLVADELVSIGQQAESISQPLLQAVVAHVQMTQSDKCFSRWVPLRFVHGSNHSQSHFLRELEALQLPNYTVKKVGDYFYLTPRPQQTLYRLHSILTSGEDDGRSKTPPPGPLLPVPRSHRRSLSSGYPQGHVPPSRLPQSQPKSMGVSAEGSRDSFTGSMTGYEASQSCSTSSILSVSVCEEVTQETQAWIILRPLPDRVEMFLQLRSSRPEANLDQLSLVCGELEEAISKVCRRTNQWFLLKDLLDSRVCSPYLLSESASEAWVDQVVSKHESTGSKDTREPFRGQEFMCDLQWKRHITPHWRLKDKGAQTGLRITRAALDVFSVSNRQDVYVFQDISSTGEESIFYLKIDESLCRVEDYSMETSITMVTDDGIRPDTRATVEGAETLSSVSIQPSLSEVAPELEKRSSLEQTPSVISGKPQESLVFQLYGLKKPSHDLTERLNQVVQFKLDDAVLEAMCALYTRNQRLRLFPADVLFLQPSIPEPSHILSLPLPSWATSVEALTFYYLQNFSLITLRPNYTSSDHRDHFQVPLELQNAYLSETCDSSHEIHQDHLFLYIRPHKKGRGMGVISVSLVSPEGRIMTPLPGVVQPSNKYPQLNDAGIEGYCTITEIPSEVKGQYNIRLHVWEKGNIGLREFMSQAVECFKHTMVDYILELHLLHLPVATPLKNRGARETSPFVLIDYTERRDSANEELETVVEEMTTVQPHSRRVSKGSRTGNSRRGSNESRRGSNDSRRSLAEGGPSRKTSVDSKLERTLEIESLHKAFQAQGDNLKQSQAFTEQIIESVDEILSDDDHRQQKNEELVDMEPTLGNQGALSDYYQTTIPQHLACAVRLGALSVRHRSFDLLGTHSANVFLSQATSTIKQVSPDLTVNVFASTTSGQLVHFDPPTDWTKVEQHVNIRLRNICYILIGRNLDQFRECRHPDNRSNQAWLEVSTNVPLQLFQPLDCLKAHQTLPVPLQHMPIAAEAFVPRQRLVVTMVTSSKADVWLYNFSEESYKRLSHHLSKVDEWVSSRSGVLHHILAQKLGLFQHTQSKDLKQCTKLAVKKCPGKKELIQVVKSNSPLDTVISSSSRLQRPVLTDSPLLHTSYQDSAPQTPLPLVEDPVYTHGRQLSSHLAYQRRDYESQELLGKVFQSWQSRSLAPVSGTAISAVKRMARLLHLCSSPILPARCSKDKALSEVIKEELLSQYIAYLEQLGFQAIAERSSTPSSQKPPPPQLHTHTKLYKCLQRWWAGGIILTELCFNGDDFIVKLYSLEVSRLSNQSPLTPEALSHFSLECARYKDFIHVHSFMMDFHLRLLLHYLSSTPLANFDIRQYIELCEERPRPHFARNLLCKGGLDVAAATVSPRELYQYLLVHCAKLGASSIELRSVGSAKHEDVGLLLEVNRSVTSPQLSKLIEDSQDMYDIRVLLSLRAYEDSRPVLPLDYYLLLVHRNDSHPQLIRHSPHLMPTCHAITSGDFDGNDAGESEFNMEVQERRRKMGLLSTPPQASQCILNTRLIHEHMVGVKAHLEDVCQGALSRMRRDALWKRLVYGQPSEEGGQSPLEGLSCSEFRELLRLVRLVPLDSLDQRLTPLRKQSRRWYKKLFLPLQVRFSDSIRLYRSEDESYSAAVIINPEWQDMALIMQVDKDTRSLCLMYRHPKEGGSSRKERLITANLEAERAHIETVINFMCSFLWASILDTSPPQPQLNLL